MIFENPLAARVTLEEVTLNLTRVPESSHYWGACQTLPGRAEGRLQWTDPQGRSISIFPSSHKICTLNLKHVYFKTRY